VVKVTDSLTLEPLLSFIDAELEKDNIHKDSALRVHFLFFEPFLRAFWNHSEKPIPVPFTSVHHAINGFANSGTITIDPNIALLADSFFEIIPDADNLGAEWQDVFTQDSLFCMSSLLKHFQIGTPRFDDLFKESVNTFGKFSELLAERFDPNNSAGTMQRYLALSGQGTGRNTRSVISEIEILVYGN